MAGPGPSNSAAMPSGSIAPQPPPTKETCISDRPQTPQEGSGEGCASAASKHAATLKLARDLMTKATELNELIPSSHRSPCSAEKNMLDVLDRAVKYLKWLDAVEPEDIARLKEVIMGHSSDEELGLVTEETAAYVSFLEAEVQRLAKKCGDESEAEQFGDFGHVMGDYGGAGEDDYGKED